MSAVPSSSTRNPIDTTLIAPSRGLGSPGVPATGTVCGAILPSVPPRRPSTPSMRGTLKPQMSASSTPTVKPSARERGGEVHRDRRLADAALAARDREHARRRRHLGGRGVLAGVPAGALHRGRLLLRRSSRRTRPSRSVTPGRPRTFDSTSRLIWARSGQPGGGERDGHADVAVGRHRDVVDHARARRCWRGARGRSRRRASRGRRRPTAAGPRRGWWTGAPGSSGSGCRGSSSRPGGGRWCRRIKTG